MKIQQIIKANLIPLAGAALGIAAGWSYWYFVGCASGGCAITSNPLNSSLYGGLMGFLVGQSLRPKPKTDSQLNK
jgi:hypothetical protein